MSNSNEIKARIQSIDLLRGVVMIIMALDHCRDFFHLDSINGQNPLDLKTTSTGLFLTRWITHFCAPIFVFLAGTSIFFVKQRRSLNAVSRFLLTRGLWLVLLEITIINWGWVGNWGYAFLGLFVIWALGCGMILMAGFVHLPKLLIWILGFLFVFGHNLLDGFDSLVKEDASGLIWSILHVQHGFPIDDSHLLFIGYPLIPWVGIMIFGYLFGNLYSEKIDYVRRKKILLQLGVGSLLLFVALRSGNYYGEHHHWETQANGPFSLLSFLDTSKYPPSLLYTLMTIGPAFLFLAYAEKWKSRFLDWVIIFGRVPFFYYILHVYLIHTIAFIVFFASGYHWTDMDPHAVFGGFPKGYGLDLWLVYVLWALVVIILYFPCRWYNHYKSTHKQWWLSYL